MNIQPLKSILGNHGVSDSQWQSIKNNITFSSMLAQAVIEWNAAVNGSQRVEVKAATIVESLLPRYYAELENTSHPLNHRTELFKLIARFAKIGNDDEKVAVGSGSGFNLNISIGQQPMVIQGRVIDTAVEQLA